MTLEGGFAAASAIMEMLMQSWGGTIRLFPTVPDAWSEAFFEDLRAEGGFLVSAQMLGGGVTYARIVSTVGGACTLRNPWPGQQVDVCGPDGELTLSGDDLQWQTEAGAEYLVFAVGAHLDEGELCPAPPTRPDWQSNWFGLQMPPRF